MASRGNNKADHLANVGAALQAAGPEPFLPLSNAIIKAVALEDTLNTWTEKWHSLWNCRQSKIFFPDPQPAVSKNLLKLPRKEVGMLVRAFTGFSYLGYPQFLVHPGVVNPTCRLCGEAREENHHIIKSCPALVTLCMTILWHHILPDDDWSINGLISFLQMPQVAKLEERSPTDQLADPPTQPHFVLPPGETLTRTTSLRCYINLIQKPLRLLSLT
jgi:hypothetical protein